MLTLEEILGAIKAAAEPTPPVAKMAPYAPPPDPDDHPLDIPTILHSTDKLLAISRGTQEPDERDSLGFRRLLAPEDLLAERVAMDAGGIRKVAMRRLSRQKNLKMLPPNFFTSYGEGILFGNPLATPLEETNPLHIVEQARRVSQMGVGGLPDSGSVTPEAQAVHPSVFGFIDAIAGPESELAGVDTRLAVGARIGTDGKVYQRMINRRTGREEWVSPDKLQGKVLGLPE